MFSFLLQRTFISLEISLYFYIDIDIVHNTRSNLVHKTIVILYCIINIGIRRYLVCVKYVLHAYFRFIHVSFTICYFMSKFQYIEYLSVY